MPEDYLNPEKKNIIKNDLEVCRAKEVFDRKSTVLNNRIGLLEKENAEFNVLLENEKAINLGNAQAISTVSHDCRTPLTSIQLSVSLIEHYYDRLDKEKMFLHLDRIKLAVTELTEKLSELIKREDTNTPPILI